MKFMARTLSVRTVLAIQVLAALSLFALDVLTPPGVADGIGYPIVLVLCLWVPSRRYLIGWTLGVCALVVLGALCAPEVLSQSAIINRSLAICSVSIFAVLIAGRQSDVQTFRLLAEQAQEANQAKTDFLANMSHELRTPLNAIVGFSEIIAGELFGSIGQRRYAEYARDIHSSGIHLLAVVSDILDLARIEAGHRQVLDSIVSVYDAVEASMRLLRGRAESRRIRLVSTVVRDAPGILADERAVRQMLLNLLSNAVKFTPEGGRVAVAIELRADGSLAISVDDTGVGIAPEDIPRALAPFSQVDNSLSREHGGTGLGLPLVKSLIELHGGKLELESELGKGTVASIVFPAARVQSPQDDRVFPTHRSLMHSQSSGSAQPTRELEPTLGPESPVSSR